MKPQPRYRPSDRIGGRYQVHQALMGGMGEVYLCLDLEEMHPCALKTFQLRYQTDARRLRQAFEREVATWVALEKHPNIVRCFYMDILDNQPFMVLEWIAGEEGRGTDLRGWLRRGPLDLRQALDFTIDICRGLLHAQEKQPGLVHRDLKPENVLIAQGGLAKITDFGLAEIIQETGLKLDAAMDSVEADGRQSMVGRKGIVGTPAYMAPEQWRGESLDERTDIYALGCMLYEMLTGEPLFQANLATDTPRHLEQWLSAMQVRHEEGPVPTLPISLQAVLGDLLRIYLAKSQSERPASLGKMSRQLEDVYRREFTTGSRADPHAEQFTAIGQNNRGGTYNLLHRHDEALRDFNQAIEIDPNLAGAYANRANTYAALKQYEAALADYTQAIKLAPNLSRAYSGRGLIYQELQEYEAALADHGRAIELDPSDPQSYTFRGTTYHALRNYRMALADFSSAIQVDPKYAKAYDKRGNTYADLRQYEAAMTEYARAIDLDPYSAKTYFNRGCTHHELQEYEAALADYTRSIELDPSNAAAYHNRGFVYQALKQHEKALTDYDQAIDLEPDDAQTYCNRGNTFHALGEYKAALIDYECAIELDSKNRQAYVGRGMTYHALQHYAEALADYSFAIELDPNYALAYSSRGIVYANLQRHEAALADYGRALELGDEDAGTYCNRGDAYASSHRYEAALADYSCAIELEPRLLRAHVGRANMHAALQQYVAALADCTNAIELASEDAQLYYNRGVIYQALHRYEEALTDYSRAIVLEPRWAHAYYNRGTTHNALQQYNAALADFTHVIEQDPSLGQAHFNVGALLTNQGRFREALPYFEAAAQLGETQAAQAIARLEQLLDRETAPHIDPAREAFEAFQQAGSVEAMQQAVTLFPLMTHAEFIAAVEQAIAQQVPPQHSPAFDQRLAWLRQIASEQQRQETDE